MTEETPQKETAPPVATVASTPAELKRLLDERKELNARIRAAKVKARAGARTLRNRHGILTGLAVLDWMEAHKSSPAFTDEVQRARDWWLRKPDERALFGLPPRLELVTPARKRKAKPGADDNSAGMSATLSHNAADATRADEPRRETGSA